MKKTLQLFATASALLLSLSAQATPLMNETGLTGTVTHEDFNKNTGNGTVAGSQFANLKFGSGIFVNNDYNGSFPRFKGSAVANFGSCCQKQTSFAFNTSVTDIAFAFVTNPGSTTFSAYLSNMLVETFTAPTGYSGTYYGFQNIAFDQVRIDTSDTINGAWLMDDLQYKTAEVPEPASLALIALGLAGLAVRRRQQG